METLDAYWAAYDAGAKELEGVQTVDEVIDICAKYFGKSSGDAFFPGGTGDVELLPVLLEAGWKRVWVQASYYFAVRQPQAVCLVCREKIESDHRHGWIHSHADKDHYCGTGDGATAVPDTSTGGLTYVEGDIYRGVQRPVV